MALTDNYKLIPMSAYKKAAFKEKLSELGYSKAVYDNAILTKTVTEGIGVNTLSGTLVIMPPMPGAFGKEVPPVLEIHVTAFPTEGQLNQMSCKEVQKLLADYSELYRTLAIETSILDMTIKQAK